MKLTIVVASVFLLSVSIAAKEAIRIETKIFEAPKGVEITKDVVDAADFFKNTKIDVMSSPTLIVLSGQTASITVAGTDAGTGIPVGQMVEICPTLNGNQIDVVTHAESHKVEKKEAVNTPFEFSGTCANGGTVLLMVKNEKTGRTECVYLKVMRVK